MDKLSSIARKIDVVFRILGIALLLGMAAMLVGLAFLGVSAAFGLPVAKVPELDSSFRVGPCTFYAAFATMSFGALFPRMALVLAAAIVTLIPAWMAVRTIGAILRPMTEGQPFQSAVSRNVKRLAWLTLTAGGLRQLLQAAKMLLSGQLFGVDVRLFGQTCFLQISPDFLRTDRELHVELCPEFSLGFLVLAAVLLLLACVFRYGEELQTLSDETL